MLKKFGCMDDGRPLIVLGLSGENMTRLMADEPIMVQLPDAAGGLPSMPTCVIVLCGGRTEADIADQIASSPVARLLCDNPSTPGRSVLVVDVTPAEDEGGL